MYRIKHCNKMPNYSNIADDCYITIKNTPVCGRIPLEENKVCRGTLYLKCPPENGELSIDELGFWKYTPKQCYIGFDCFKIVYCDWKGRRKFFTTIISVTPCKKAFKQINIQEYIEIPDIKPDIEEILDICIDIDIVYKDIIRTSKGTSYEGQKITGCKLLVAGFLKLHIQYIADEVKQSVYSANFNIPFATYIVLPENYCELFPVNVKVYLEDIFYQQIDKRHIFKNVTLLLTGIIC